MSELGKSLIAVVLIALICTALGAIAGAGVGNWVPEYYRSVFSDGQSPTFRPVRIGIFLGAMQGCATGVVIAIAIIGLLAWRDRQRITPDATEARLEEPQCSARYSWPKVLAVTAMGLLLLLGTAGIAFVAGGLVGQQQLYDSLAERKLHKLNQILSKHDAPYVRIEFSSAAQVYYIGHVDDETVRNSLHQSLVEEFGRDEANTMITAVGIAH